MSRVTFIVEICAAVTKVAQNSIEAVPLDVEKPSSADVTSITPSTPIELHETSNDATFSFDALNDKVLADDDSDDADNSGRKDPSQ